MEAKKSLLTYAGLKKLEDELHDLKVNRRKEVAGKIKEAREQGDLSENAEYDAAKDEQRDIETRIEAVSYTHLDVYKRQILAWLGADLVLVPSYFYMMRKLHLSLIHI